MRNRFDEQLELLNVELIRMGSLCEDAIEGASKALAGESGFAEQVRAIEHEIDQKERDIENLCFKLLTRDQLLSKIWGYDFDGETRTVDVHIRTLRQKLGLGGNYIETIRGVGYKMEEI